MEGLLGDRAREGRDREARPLPRTSPPASAAPSYFQRFEQCMVDCESDQAWKCWAAGVGGACIGGLLGGPPGAIAGGVGTGPTCFIAMRHQCQVQCRGLTSLTQY